MPGLHEDTPAAGLIHHEAVIGSVEVAHRVGLAVHKVHLAGGRGDFDQHLAVQGRHQVAGEVETVAHLQDGAGPDAGRQDEDVDVFPLERHQRSAVRGPAAVARPGEGGHDPAADGVAVGQVDPAAALPEILVETALQVAVDDADVLEFEVVREVTLVSHPGLVVEHAVQPPVTAAFSILSNRFTHPHARPLRGKIDVRDLVGLLGKQRHRLTGGRAGEQGQRVGGHAVIEITGRRDRETHDAVPIDDRLLNRSDRVLDAAVHHQGVSQAFA